MMMQTIGFNIAENTYEFDTHKRAHYLELK
jgi:hypothetical protein